MYGGGMAQMTNFTSVPHGSQGQQQQNLMAHHVFNSNFSGLPNQNSGYLPYLGGYTASGFQGTAMLTDNELK